MRLMRDLVGDTLSGRYRLVARLAGGGMGEVYRGQDLLLERKVAVKVLQPSLSNDPAFVARFRQEARAAARLSHPNIVAVHDWGSEDDDRTYYMVMEYVSGTDLRDVLVARGAIDVGRSLEIGAKVCAALEAAHQVGLVHRDVKPENVLLSRDGGVKVADFGIASVADAELTAPGGGIPGTLRYLAPEQLSGEDATTAADIWAAGAVLYELITGGPLVSGPTADLIARRAGEPPAPSAIEPHTPPQVDAIVARACATAPADRFRSAAEMGAAIEQVSAGLPQTETLDDLLDEVTGEVILPGSEPTTMVGTDGPARNPSMRMMRAAGFAIVALLVLLAGGRAISALTSPSPVEVPALADMRKSEVTTLAEELGLDLEVSSRRSLGIPRGKVISQDPAPGFVDAGSTISVVVSSGPPKVDVLYVVGVDLDVATVRLRARGLRIGEVEQRNDAAPEGTIVAQSPPDGQLRRGAKVALVVSLGPLDFQVPNVEGLSFKKAKSVLEAAGFVAIKADAYSDDVPVGKVVATQPLSGAMAPQGSEITILVSVGPEFRKLKMPDVRNQGVDAARTQLENLGLRVRVVQSCGGGGTTVVDTDPIAGTTVRENDLVALFVC